MSTHNIGFYEDLTKIIFELSSNTHLISSADSKMLITAPKKSHFLFCLISLFHMQDMEWHLFNLQTLGQTDLALQD